MPVGLQPVPGFAIRAGRSVGSPRLL